MQATMTNPVTPTAPVSKPALWTGWILSTLIILFMIMDGVVKLIKIQPVLESCIRMQIPVSVIAPIGIVGLVCTLIYAIPRTALLGAVLLTGYFGGAVCLHLRINDPLFSHTLFPTYLGAVAWVGLYLRDPRLRALVSGK